MSFREFVTNALGIAVLVYAGAVLWAPLTDGGDGLERAKGILALLGPIVGTVLGFYFGARSGERLAEQADARRERSKRTAEAAVDSASQLTSRLLERIRRLEERSHGNGG